MTSADKHMLSPPSTRLRPPLVDTLSTVLRSVRVTGAALFAVDAAAPWTADAPPARDIGQRILPDAQHFIEFVWIRSGACWGGLTGEPPARLEEGDVMLFPRGDEHVVSSSPVGHGGMLGGATGERTQVICGFLGCDTRPTHPLLSALPAAMHVPRQSQYDAMLEQLVELALTESVAARDGGALVIAHLSELLFVEIVRRYVATLPRESVGWFAGLQDENVGRALRKLHDRPAHGWNLGLLARETGMSRSALAGRFSELVGVPPMHYLAQWRMQLASNLLSSTSFRVSEVAERVGYASEAALSRAFKRWSGVAPAEWRRGRRNDIAARP